MLYIKATNLTKSYTTKPLFQNINFTISDGQKIALVAKNGTGKSTLLKAIIGELDLTDGNVEIKKGLKIGFLSQSSFFDSDKLVIDVLFDNNDPNIQVIKKYEELLLSDKIDNDELEKILAEIEQLHAWEYENKVKIIMSKLQITHCLYQKISTLSGGEAKRVSLAKILVDSPDIMILDEPTNHLDLNMIEWLESYFKQYDMTLLLVTHDRFFLERVCNEIRELDRGELNKYPGNYSYYLEKKMMRDEMDKIALHKMKRLYKNELAWIRRAPSGRGTKSVFRQQRFEEINQEYESQKDLLHKESIKLEISSNVRKLGSKILVTKKVNKSFGQKVILKDFSHEFKHQERIGIIGNNGVGKTTFVNILMGLVDIDFGRLEIGETIVFGYYYQKDVIFPENKRIIDVVRDISEFIIIGKNEKISAGDLLIRFLFPQSQWFVIANSLSGGEKRRLYLLTILMKSPNFLILDEPTNDLDLITIGVLEEFLLQYQGCLIIVSHDRFFMDKLVDHIFVFKGEGVVQDFWGTYTEYRQHESVTKIDKPKIIKNNIETNKQNQTKKLSYKELREFEQLELDILQLENRKKEIEISFQTTDLNSQDISTLSKEIGEIVIQLEEKEVRWLELSERV